MREPAVAPALPDPARPPGRVPGVFVPLPRAGALPVALLAPARGPCAGRRTPERELAVIAARASRGALARIVPARERRSRTPPSAWLLARHHGPPRRLPCRPQRQRRQQPGLSPTPSRCVVLRRPSHDEPRRAVLPPGRPSRQRRDPRFVPAQAPPPMRRCAAARARRASAPLPASRSGPASHPPRLHRASAPPRMCRSSPNSISGSFTARTKVISPANAAAICPGSPPAPRVKLVASKRQRASGGEQQRPADRDEHDRHQRVAPDPRQMRELRDRRQRDERWPCAEHQRQQDGQRLLGREQGRRRTTTPTITRNAPNTPPAPSSSAPPNRTVMMLARPLATTGKPRIACVSVFVAATVCSTSQR